MDTLGNPAQRAVQKLSPATPTNFSAKSKRIDSENLPPMFDQTVDRNLQSLICFRQNNGAVELRRALTPAERLVVEAREGGLWLAIEPYGSDDRKELAAFLSTMFSGFRSMRQQGENVDETIMVTLVVLREFPFWAIKATCLKVASGNGNPHWAPNDAELSVMARAMVEPYRAAHDRARRLLEAKVA
jgi:hypothetical protein